MWLIERQSAKYAEPYEHQVFQQYRRDAAGQVPRHRLSKLNKKYNMKKITILCIVLINIFLQNNIWSQNYDFKAVSPSGQTLYYRLIENDFEVMVVNSPQGHTISGNLIIPDSVEYWGIYRPVTQIGQGAFSGSSNLHSVKLPGKLRRIEAYAFSKTGLTSIDIPQKVYSIGREAFSYCRQLKKVVANCWYTINSDHLIFVGCDNIEEAFLDYDFEIPHKKLKKLVYGNKITSIKHIFQNSDNLRMVVIGDEITHIPNNCFEDCDNLRTVIIGEKVEGIGAKAFRKCINLDSIIAKPTKIVPGIDPSAFNFTPSSKVVVTHCNMNYSSIWGTSDFKYVNAETYTLTLNVRCSECGKISIIKNVDCDNTTTIKATPSNNYAFKCWSDGNTENPRTITLTQNTTLNALFEKNRNSVEVKSDNVTMGKVEGTGSYEIGKNVTVMALANCGYRFKQWSNGKKENPLSFTPLCDTNLIAFFEIATDTVYIQDVNKKAVIIYDTMVSPVIIHDTTIKIVEIVDTTIYNLFLFDTVNVRVPIFDTVRISVPLFDTVNLNKKDYSTLYLSDLQSNIDTIIISDTLSSKTGNCHVLTGKMYTKNGFIFLDGIQGERVTIYNKDGRVVIDDKMIYNNLERYEVPVSDVYIVKISNSVFRTLVVIK